MNSLTLKDVSLAPLDRVSLELGAGLHVFLGPPQAGGAELVEACAGLRKVRRGRLRVDGKNPHDTPQLRARIGSVLKEERWCDTGTVLQQASLALELRAEKGNADTLLDEAGLGSMKSRSAHSLTPSESRGLALTLALAIEAPLMICLYEPLAYVAEVKQSWVLDRLRRLSATTCVLCTTTSARDAAFLSDHSFVLDRGRVVRRPGSHLGDLVPGSVVTLGVHVATPRALSAALSADPRVEGVEWNGETGRIFVRGHDAEQVSLAVLDGIKKTKTQLYQLSPSYPSIQEIEAATTGLAKAAHEAAYRTAERAHVAAWARATPAGRDS